MPTAPAAPSPPLPAGIAIPALLLAATLGLWAGVVPRGLPVWLNLVSVTAVAAMLHGRTLASLRPDRAAVAAVAAFLAVAAASLAWTPAARAPATLGELGYIAAAALLGGHAAATLAPAPAERLGSLFVGGLVAGIVLFAVEVNAGFPLYHLWHGGTANPDLAYLNVPKRAAAALAVLVWPAALFLHRRWTGRAWVGLLALLIIVSLGQTSRSAMVGTAAGVAVLLLARRWATGTRRLLAGVTVAAFVGVLPLALLAERAGHLSEADWLFLSARHRIEIWDRAATKLLEAPLTGFGLDASRAVPANGVTSKFEPMQGTLLPLHPHNAFLQIWFELGAAGAAAAAAVLLLVLRGIARLPRPDQPFALALYAAGMVLSSTAYGIWQAWWMAVLMAAGLLLRLALRAPRRSARPAPCRDEPA